MVSKDTHDLYLCRETKDKHDKVYLWTYTSDAVTRWDATLNTTTNELRLTPLVVSGVQPHMTWPGGSMFFGLGLPNMSRSVGGGAILSPRVPGKPIRR